MYACVKLNRRMEVGLFFMPKFDGFATISNM